MLTIPTPPPGFCGRENELNELNEHFNRQNVMLIAGIGGMGKTTLCLAFAHKLLQEHESFRERIIWLPCKDGWDENVLATEIIQQIINLTGRKDYSSKGVTPFSEIVKIIEENSITLFIDDFQLVENDQTCEFVRLAKEYLNEAHLIIMTRKRLSLSRLDLVDIFELRLEGLQMEHSSSLIESMLISHGFEKPNDTNKKKIYSLIKGHPFSIKLFTSFLILGEFSLDSLLSDTSVFHQERESHLLDRIWEELTEEERNVLILLSVFRIPVRGDGIEELRGRDKRRTLRSLLDYYLIEYDNEGRVFLQDVLKGYVRTKVMKKQKLALHSMAAFYFSEYRKAEINEQKEAYFHHLRAEEIEKAVDLIIRIGRELLMIGEEVANNYLLLEDALKKCSGYRKEELLLTKSRFLLLWVRINEAENLLEEIDSDSLKNLLMGRVSFKKKHYRDASGFFERALSEVSDQQDRVDILNTLALCHNNSGDTEKAEQYFMTNLAELSDEISPLIKAKCYSNYAIFLDDRGEYYKAIEFNKKAEEIYRNYDALSPLVTVVYNMAVYYFGVNKLEQALSCIKESMVMGKKINDMNMLVFGHMLMGEVLFLLSDNQGAIKSGRAAISIAEKHGLDIIKASILMNLGDVYFRLNDFDRAQTYYRDSLDIHHNDMDLIQKAYSQVSYARVLIVRRELSKAMELLKEVHSFSERSQHQELLCFSYYYMQRAAFLSGDKDVSSQYGAHFQEAMHVLPVNAQERLKKLFSWFEENLTGAESKEFLVLCREKGRIEASASEIATFHSEKENFDIFIDFQNRELLVDGKMVNLFRKKTLVPLLADLALAPGKSKSSAELFEKNWEREYDMELDGASLRKAVSRIRYLLDESDKERFICSSDEPGSYHFSTRINYCIITANKKSEEK